MNKAVVWFYLSLKRQLKRPFFLVLLFLLPLSSMFFKQMEKQDTNGIRIAFYFEQDEGTGAEEKKLFEDMKSQLQNSQEAFEFYECAGREELAKEVSSRKAECGYVFNGGLLEKLDIGKYRNSIDLVTAPSTVAAKLSTEVVFAAMFEVYGERLLKNYMENSEIFKIVSPEEAWSELKPLYAKYNSNDSTFSFTYSTYGRQENTAADDSGIKAAFPVRGLVAVYVFLIGLFSAVMLCEDERRGLFLPVQATKRPVCAAMSLAAPVTLAAVSGLTALWLAGEVGSLMEEAGLMASYVVATTLFSWILQRVIRQPLVLCSLIPFAAMVCLLVCPVFVDITAFTPAAKVLRLCLLPYYYMVGSGFF